jgi:hypothetical protein
MGDLEILALSNIRKDDLLTEVLYKMESDFFKALDIVSQIVEIREMNKIVKKIRSRGWVGDVDCFVKRVDVKDPVQFKKKILEKLQDVPVNRGSYWWGRMSCLHFCERRSDKT